MAAEWPGPQARSVVFSRGLQLALCEWGDIASAPLVLVGAHGYLDCAEFFAPLAAALRARRTDLAFAAMSFAGHGRSSWADTYGWYDHTADLLAVTRAVTARAPGTATIGMVGHSFGAVQVLQALQLEPGLADVVVNLDAVSEPPTADRGGLPGALAELAARGGDARPLPGYDDLEAMVARRARSNPRLPVDLLRWLVASSGPRRRRALPLAARSRPGRVGPAVAGHRGAARRPARAHRGAAPAGAHHHRRRSRSPADPRPLPRRRPGRLAAPGPALPPA